MGGGCSPTQHVPRSTTAAEREGRCFSPPVTRQLRSRAGRENRCRDDAMPPPPGRLGAPGDHRVRVHRPVGVPEASTLLLPLPVLLGGAPRQPAGGRVQARVPFRVGEEGPCSAAAAARASRGDVWLFAGEAPLLPLGCYAPLLDGSGSSRQGGLVLGDVVMEGLHLALPWAVVSSIHHLSTTTTEPSSPLSLTHEERPKVPPGQKTKQNYRDPVKRLFSTRTAHSLWEVTPIEVGTHPGGLSSPVAIPFGFLAVRCRAAPLAAHRQVLHAETPLWSSKAPLLYGPRPISRVAPVLWE